MFIIVKVVNASKNKEAPAPKEPSQEELFAQIRDL
jgi:large-conductance mechanosensitive channel